jgi:hypothetical protein
VSATDADKISDPKPRRGHPDGLGWIARQWDFDKLGVEVDSITCDGHEPDSAIVLHTNRGRVVIPGTAVLLSGAKLQAVLSAALHYGAPKLTGDRLRDIADVLFGLASVREIHSSEHAAFDWGRSYLYPSHIYEVDLDADTADARRVRWGTVERLCRDHHGDLRVGGPHPARVLVRASDAARLVVRPWFHAHVRDLTPKADRLSEQRIASLMALVGWEAFPLSRSSLTVRNPDDRSQAEQLRLYVVREGWEEAE